MAEDQRLEDDLRELGRHLRASPAPTSGDIAGIPGAVRARLESGRRWSVRRIGIGSTGSQLSPGRIAVALVVVLAAVLAGTPVGRAAVVEVLRFAGVEVRQEAAPTPGTGAGPSGPRLRPGEIRSNLADARARAAFTVYVPAVLGGPDAVTVRGGDPPRIVSLIYRDDHIRLDEFDGRMGPYFRKYASLENVEMVRVGERPALWVRGPHTVVYVDRDGETHTETARLVGNTLIWEVDGVTLRLEGDLTRGRAVSIAESVFR